MIELSQVALCNDCGLKNNVPFETIRALKNRFLIILESEPTVQQKDYLIKAIGNSRESFSLAAATKCGGGKFSTCKKWLWQEMGIVSPEKTFVFGKNMADLLIGKKKWKFYEASVVSYMTGEFYPIQSISYLMNRGIKEYEQITRFFQSFV